MDTPTKPTRTSLREGLLEEHAAIGALLERVIGAALGNDTELERSAWRAFEAVLTAHLDAEDTQLIPALPRARERSARVLVQEHRHLRDRVAELSAQLPFRGADLQSLRVFFDVLQAHARNDDRLLYEWADAQLETTQRNAALVALSERLDSARAKAPP